MLATPRQWRDSQSKHQPPNHLLVSEKVLGSYTEILNHLLVGEKVLGSIYILNTESCL